jgi:hypothetical protein
MTLFQMRRMRKASPIGCLPVFDDAAEFDCSKFRQRLRGGKGFRAAAAE